MQRRTGAKTRGELIFEQVVWHAAAGAALAVMILVLLLSLDWLDEIAPQPEVGAPPPEPTARLARPVVPPVDRSVQPASMSRPSG
jgi:hypothetical protein